MKYIDKYIDETQGTQLIDKLLEDSWNEAENRYVGVDYDGLSKPDCRKLMLSEQQNLCCYCLGRIHSDNTTLEHIIPHKIEKEKFNEYLVVAVLTDNVIHKQDFDRNVKEIPPLKYPHDIAYHNLIASCDSKTHCNHFRGDKPIYPLIYE